MTPESPEMSAEIVVDETTYTVNTYAKPANWDAGVAAGTHMPWDPWVRIRLAGDVPFADFKWNAAHTQFECTRWYPDMKDARVVAAHMKLANDGFADWDEDAFLDLVARIIHAWEARS